MGGGGSKDALLSRLGQVLPEAERKALELSFAAISGSREVQSFTEAQFKSYLSRHYQLPGPVAGGLCRALRRERQVQGRPAAHVTFPDFVQHASHLLRGDHGQRSVRLHLLCGGEAANMADTLHTFLGIVLSEEKLFPHFSAWPSSPENVRLVSSQLCKPLTSQDGGGSSQDVQSVTVDELEAWLVRMPAVVRLLDVTFALFFYRELLLGEEVPAELRGHLGLPVEEEEGEEGGRRLVTERTLVPVQTIHPLLPHTFSSSLLHRAPLLLLNEYLPVEVRGQLCPLFSSRYHGESFSTMCKGLVGRGPTLLVVRDHQGHVFGGFAAESWQFGPQFIDSAECFLFSLLPAVAVYSSTGYNHNYMYLQQNAQTLPNGLGMGGQLEYFGLWLSSEYGTGHSRGRPRCTTYGSPSLSAEEEFKVDLVEVWGVGPPLLPDKELASRPSILDKDRVAGALLEMAGRTIHSEGLREPEEGKEGDS